MTKSKKRQDAANMDEQRHSSMYDAVMSQWE